MKKSALVSSFLVLSLFFTACDNGNKQEISHNKARKIIPKDEFQLTDLNGTLYNIKKINNGFALTNIDKKVIILDIYATWCPPCRAAAHHLSSLQKKYKDDLIIIGLSIEAPITNAKLQEFKKNYNINYTLVNSKQNQRLINEVASSLDVGERFPIPLMAIYKDAKLINYYVGAVEEEFIESDIKIALGK